MARWFLTRKIKISHSKKQSSDYKRVLIYGSGDAGIQLISALAYSNEYHPVGLIDDSVELQGSQIRGLEIYSFSNIGKIIDKLKVDEVLIAMPSASRKRKFSIIEKLEPFPVHVKMLPGLIDLAAGKVKVSDLREVNIEDLLGRNKVEPNKSLLEKNIFNKVVLVTGAGGSIGSELCRQIISLQPKALVLFEMSEYALYTVERELSTLSSSTIKIYPYLGTVSDINRITYLLKKYSVNTIYHAAAYKHVPIVENNNSEGIKNNIFGTLNCAKAAIESDVDTFVLISTDKAVRPTNTMGATKRVAELVLQSLSKQNKSDTKFTMVRFGNVLGSSGSVIPLFKQQIKNGGPVTITDERIIRYFMTISEAVELVIQAGTIGQGGDLFVLDMGKPSLIKDLAIKMIHLSGLEVKDKSNPDGDIEIEYIGLRPGEKLYEELLIGENVSETEHPKIMRAEESMIEWVELKKILDDLEVSIKNQEHDNLVKLLLKAVPEFKSQS